MASPSPFDLAIVGGGLAGSLVALALAERRPEVRVALIERGAALGGNHLWSFFGADVAADGQRLLSPVVAHRWPDYDVIFPAHRRTLAEPYHTVRSERLDAHLRATLPAHAIVTGRDVAEVAPTRVTFADGDAIDARAVLDARGTADVSALEVGWQCFVGGELTVAGGHGRTRPIVMDASVAQHDAYRFVYTLPFTPDTILVEDTYYADAPVIEDDAWRARIHAYAAAQGWQVERADRWERGALPVVMGGDFAAYWRGGGAVAKVGARAGLFHPTTGYSLPDAVRSALLIADATDLSAPALLSLTHDHAVRLWRQRGFYRMLDRMLFKAAEPEERYRVLERFYRLPPALIARFYAARSTPMDKVRVLAGRPPVPVVRAIRALAAAA